MSSRVASASATSSPPRLAVWQHIMGWGMVASLATAAAFVAKDLGAWVGFSALNGATSLVPTTGPLLNLLVIAGTGLVVLALIVGCMSMLVRDRADHFDRHLVLWAPAMVLLSALI